MLQNQTICFLGAGSMAEAMIAGMLNKGVLQSENITITNRSNQERLHYLESRYRVRPITEKKEAVPAADILILAMKPKDVDVALDEIKGLLREDQLIISVLAGISTSYIVEKLSRPVPVIRTMPNTSSAVGLSATALTGGHHSLPQHLEKATIIFESIGTVCVVEEEQIDAVTGLSGSGPAYIYYLVEAMEAAGKEAGLHPDIARQLTIQTLLGAAHMLQETKEDPSILRERVTSPGGTTMAGLEILKSLHFQESVRAAIHRAAERSRELGQILR